MGCTCLQVQHVAPSAYCLAWVHLTSTAATSDGGVFLRRVDLPSRAAHRKGGVPSFLGDLAFTAAPRDDGALLIWDALACKCSTLQGRRVACLGCLGLLRLRLVIAACCDHVAVRSILDLLHSSKQNNLPVAPRGTSGLGQIDLGSLFLLCVVGARRYPSSGGSR